MPELELHSPDILYMPLPVKSKGGASFHVLPLLVGLEGKQGDVTRDAERPPCRRKRMNPARLHGIYGGCFFPSQQKG